MFAYCNSMSPPNLTRADFFEIFWVAVRSLARCFW